MGYSPELRPRQSEHVLLDASTRDHDQTQPSAALSVTWSVPDNHGQDRSLRWRPIGYLPNPGSGARREPRADLGGKSTSMTEPILERDPRLRLVVDKLIEAYAPERIYLFGSIARGDADQDSDYDLMVVVPDDAPMERQGSRLARQALR